MTMKEAIQRADGLRMNTISDDQKATWINDLDGQLAEMFGAAAPENKWPEEDRTLLMPEPHTEIYPLYLICKIDYYNQETTLYANDRSIYNTALNEAIAWYRRQTRPARLGNWRVM